MVFNKVSEGFNILFLWKDPKNRKKPPRGPFLGNRVLKFVRVTVARQENHFYWFYCFYVIFVFLVVFHHFCCFFMFFMIFHDFWWFLKRWKKGHFWSFWGGSKKGGFWGFGGKNRYSQRIVFFSTYKPWQKRTFWRKRVFWMELGSQKNDFLGNALPDFALFVILGVFLVFLGG